MMVAIPNQLLVLLCFVLFSLCLCVPSSGPDAPGSGHLK